MVSGGHVCSDSIVQLDCKVARGCFDALDVLFCSTSSLWKEKTQSTTATLQKHASYASDDAGQLCESKHPAMLE